MKVIFCMALACALGRGDSIERTDGTTVFGFVKGLDAVNLTVVARHPAKNGKTKTDVPIPRGEIESVDFNDNDFNPGGAPGVGANPPNSPSSARSTGKAKAQDRVVLDGGENRICNTSIVIEKQQIHCGKETFPLPVEGNGSVLRIFLGKR